MKLKKVTVSISLSKEIEIQIPENNKYTDEQLVSMQFGLPDKFTDWSVDEFSVINE